MIGLPIVLAALAFAGAPSLPVACNPDTTGSVSASGLTWFSGASPTHIDFGPRVCAGLIYLSATPAERLELEHLNPSVDFDWDAGVALTVVLHESHHVTGDRDEATTECFAMKSLDVFAPRYAPAGDLPTIISDARAYDATMPASYHGAAC